MEMTGNLKKVANVFKGLAKLGNIVAEMFQQQCFLV